MAGILKVDDLRGNTAAGDITITSEGGAVTMQLQQGLAKSWSRVSQSGTHTIDNSFNLSSVTDNGVGRSLLTLANAMTDNTYIVTALTKDGGGYNDAAGIHSDASGTYTSTAIELFAHFGTSPNDAEYGVWSVIHGDLA